MGDETENKEFFMNFGSFLISVFSLENYLVTVGYTYLFNFRSVFFVSFFVHQTNKSHRSRA